jgi:purine-nucleoside phosphorylase
VSQPSLWDRVEETAAHIRSRCTALPETAIVLGSGLGDFADTLLDAIATPYADLPHWPPSTVVGHAGRLVVGTVAGRRIAALSGRVHYYEGHDLATVVFATRVMARLGVRRLILTNAAGGINTSFKQGCLVVITDHINLQGVNPMVGANEDRLGPRFFDMSQAYWKPYRDAALEAGKRLGIELFQGVYCAIPGPSYETPAEIRMMRTLGADLAGMSTVPEVIAARHLGLKVLGISCVTNMAAGVTDQILSHEEVLEVGRQVRGDFIRLLEALIPKLS